MVPHSQHRLWWNGGNSISCVCLQKQITFCSPGSRLKLLLQQVAPSEKLKPHQPHPEMSPKKKSDIGTDMLEGMEWRQVSSTLEAAFSEMLDDPDTSTPKPPPPTPVTVVPESGGGGCHQSVNQLSGGCCAFVPLRAPAPHYFNEAVAPNVFMGHSAPMVDQGLMYSQHPMWSCVMYNQEVGYNPPLVSCLVRFQCILSWEFYPIFFY